MSRRSSEIKQIKGKQSLYCTDKNENIWLTQKMLAELYDVSVAAINPHIKRIFNDLELEQESTIKKYFIVQTEGSRQVNCEVTHYNLQMIIAVGFRIWKQKIMIRMACNLRMRIDLIQKGLNI